MTNNKWNAPTLIEFSAAAEADGGVVPGKQEFVKTFDASAS